MAVVAAPPAFGSCCRSGVAADAFDGFPPSGSIRDDLIPLRFPDANPGPSGGLLLSVRHRQDPVPTLARSSNFRCFHRLRSLSPSETVVGGASLGSRLVSPTRATCMSRVTGVPARRLAPWLHNGEVQPPPRELVTSALSAVH
jgi:hypothetical protein